VKSAILLAGVWAEGDTVVHEPVPTRSHTEEMLAAVGADIEVAAEGGGRIVRVRRSQLRPTSTTVPGDPSQAAFWVVGATIVPGGDVEVTGIYLGRQRTGFVDVLVRMGASIEVRPAADGAGSLTCRAASLRGTVVRAEEIPSLDEVPVLAVAAAVARGETRFHDVGELRVKESDRLRGTVDLLAAFGAEAAVEGDDLVVAGGATLRPATVDARGDHRMAMAAAVAGAACAGTGDVTTVTGWDAVATSYPGFADDLAALARGVGR
jgi:3-phosphoshikimate 1-carboxyvinyltransferase